MARGQWEPVEEAARWPQALIHGLSWTMPKVKVKFVIQSRVGARIRRAEG